MDGVNQTAVNEMEQILDQKLYDWSRNVKIAAGWACARCGEGAFDKAVLESHHIKPKHIFPKLIYDLKNGECDCLWGHALQHKDNPVIQNMILLRLVVLLTNRLYSQKTTCQIELEEICNGSNS